MVVAICAQLNIIWDDADELHRLARLSHPRITVDTAGLSPAATELANLLAERIRKLPPERVERLLDLLKSAPTAKPPPRRRRAAATAPEEPYPAAGRRCAARPTSDAAATTMR